MLILSSLFNWPVVDYRATATEKDGDYILEIELPRFKKGDVDIEVVDQILHINAKREGSKYNYSTTVPKSVDVSKIESKLEDGVLTITLPRCKKSPSVKKIEIR
jgi:HSP20 family protein